jgi:excisionase family DNA binding protein
MPQVFGGGQMSRKTLKAPTNVLHDVMTLAQAAKSLGLATVTLRVQTQRGKLRAVKAGSLWLVTKQEVERYRSEHLGRGTPPAP